MVVTFFPAAADTGVMQDLTGWPSTWTVQAPHCAMPQPNLVPVSPSSSRMTQSSGVSAGCSECASLPLTTNVIIYSPLQRSFNVHRPALELPRQEQILEVIHERTRTGRSRFHFSRGHAALARAVLHRRREGRCPNVFSGGR